jgi:DNA invertase Pin-like site-specific DNA recombinase
MNLSQLTSSQLKQLAKLAEAREALLARAAKIDRQLAAFEGGQAKPASKPAPKRPAKKRAKHGQVKNAILNLLKQSGKKGITVKEIAGKLGVGVSRIHTWFYNARKSLKQIKKLGPGKYRWQE